MLEGKSKSEDRVIAKTVRSLNKHLPIQRETLLNLLREDKPSIQGRDNSINRIRREEQDKIGGIISRNDYGKLRLPIYIELSPDYGRGIARVHGRLECEIVRKILRKEEEEKGEKGEDEREGVDEIFINREDVRKLRRELQTTTQYAFF